MNCFRKIFIFYMAIHLHCCRTVGTQNAANARIVGGASISIAQVPYLVHLRKNGEFFCGGSLVAPQYVVTAAHCVKGLKSDSLVVVGGATDLSETGVRRRVTRIFVPKSYRTGSLHMDVAVLKLNSSMSGRDINTVQLCDSTWRVGETVQVSGWGLTNENALHSPNKLRTVHVALISKSKCKQQYKNQATLTNTMFCATVPGTKDSCSGDSGGPAVYKGQLCGIVSWGIGCARKQYPGVYTNIKTVKSFIEKAMQM